MTIAEAIKKALREQGVSESYAERVEKAFGVDAVDGAAEAVKNFKEHMLPAIEEAGKTAADEVRRAAVADYEKAHGLKDGHPVATDAPQPAPKKEFEAGEVNAALREWIENQSKQIEELRAAIEQSKAAAASAARLSEAKAALQKAGLPETWLSRIDAESPIEAQIETLGDELTAIRQDAINQRVAEGGSMRPASEGDAAITEKGWAEMMNAGDGANTRTGAVNVFDGE